MHFEILVEDLSGKKMLEILAPKIIPDEHTFKVISYKGIGHIPKGMTINSDPRARQLLDQLPKLLRGYGATYKNYGQAYKAVLFIICDLDDKCLKKFRHSLLGILSACIDKPETRFCIAIEEGEAWLLGSPNAIKKAYPNCNSKLINRNKKDSICGTWELLANALYPGGVERLMTRGYQAIGKEKTNWSEKITPHIDVDKTPQQVSVISGIKLENCYNGSRQIRNP